MTEFEQRGVTDRSLVEREIYHPNLILFVEGPQGVGKTSVCDALIKTIPNAVAFRGIPESRFLNNATEEQIWQETERISLAIADSTSPCIIDRSVLSLAAYRMRRYPQRAQEYLQRGMEIFCGIAQKNPNIEVLILNTTPETCLSRKEMGFAIDGGGLSEMMQEFIVYGSISKALIENGIKCITMQNEKPTDIQDLINLYRIYIVQN